LGTQNAVNLKEVSVFVQLYLNRQLPDSAMLQLIKFGQNGIGNNHCRISELNIMFNTSSARP